jgi:hypothetical protein
LTDCENLPTCPFFKGEMAIEEERGKVYRAYYCHGGMAICARYMMFKKLGKSLVPPDLYPDQVSRAEQIIEEGAPIESAGVSSPDPQDPAAR